MNIIFPLGGQGSRFVHQGYEQSKPLIPVFGKPIMRYLVERLTVNAESDKVYVLYYAGASDCTNGPLQINPVELQEDVFYDLEWASVITYIPMLTSTCGVLETIQMAGVPTGRTTVIMDCDIFYTIDILGHVRLCKENMLFYFVDDGAEPEYSYLDLDESGSRIHKIYEKNKVSDNANAGVYVFRDWDAVSPELQLCLEDCRQYKKEPYLSELVSRMLCNGDVFEASRIDKSCIHNLGTPERVDQFKADRACLLFDLDGTLVISDHIYFEVWRQILAEFHIDLHRGLYNKTIQGQSDHVVKTRFCLPYSVEQLSHKKDSLFEKHLDRIVMVDGAAQLLEECFWEALPVVIVTNCNRASAEMIITKMGFRKFLHGLVIGGECSQPKPSPAPYRCAIEDILLTIPKNCIIFEDSKTGLLSATSCNVGMLVGLETSYDPQDLTSWGCDVTVPDFSKGVEYIYQEFYKTQRLSDDRVHTSLYNRFRGMPISISDYKLKGGFISDVICFRTHNRFDYIFKMENNSENPIRDMAGKLDLYETEYYFYESIAPTLSISTPKSLGVIRDGTVRGIVLENMFSKGYVIHETLDGMPLPVITRYLTTLVELHLTYWGMDVKSIFPRIRSPGEHGFSWGAFISLRWPSFYEKWGFMMSEHVKGVCKYIVDHFHEIEKYMCQGQRTVCHGDFKAPNIFFGSDECLLIDWQYLTFGKGAQDLVFFLIESFDVVNMTVALKEYMLSYYFLLIHKEHANYTYTEFQNDVRMSSYYFPFFVAVWFGSVDSDSLLDKNFPFFFIQRLFHFYDLCGTS